ncbi:FAD binding domain-containing protein [Haloplanus rubicundus]|uniref:Xanthine dehydrogenase family protein subunit M n=1 Tax=Haloplanus rubicundus TaxID=1547898 RepID=A0A345EGD3_9EURY|nr:xanthine dehydrogenase family protein subunit M [Haloplanus rubicundus]AXG11255.1 xanthine dehydrogenase family protein subunit M [Haloplanus rubicundus]
MYPDEFDYERPETVDEALDLLTEYPEAEVLAGGHSLLPTMKSGLASPDLLVDISRIDEMRGIDHADGTVSIGGLTNYATIDESEVVRENVTVFAEAAHAVGDVQVRNRGTVGGNLAHADPASDLPAAALAADATMVVRGPDGERRVDADDFFFGMYATDVAEDELLTHVEFPARPAATGAYAKKPSPSSGYAMVGVAVSLTVDAGIVEDVGVAANGIMDHGVRLDPVEEALRGTTPDDELVRRAAESAADELDEMMMMDDLQASAAFRAQLLESYAERALREAGDGTGVIAGSA